MTVVGQILYWVLSLYLLVLVARIVLSYIPLFNPGWRPTGTMAVVTDGVYRLTDPVIRPVERLVPPLRIGSTQINIAFLLVFIVIGVLRQATYTL